MILNMNSFVEISACLLPSYGHLLGSGRGRESPLRPSSVARFAWAFVYDFKHEKLSARKYQQKNEAPLEGLEPSTFRLLTVCKSRTLLTN
jgi:hypothetical protein